MGRIGAFVIGGVIGAAAGLLAAPRPGDETRAIVADWCNNALTDVGGICGGVQGCAQKAADSAVSAGQQAYSAASARVQEAGKEVGKSVPVVGNAAESGDELRAKIEEARQRIASQVVQNADGARAAINDTIPAVTEAMKDTAARVREEAAAVADQAAEAVQDVEAAVAPEAEEEE